MKSALKRRVWRRKRYQYRYGRRHRNIRGIPYTCKGKCFKKPKGLKKKLLEKIKQRSREYFASLKE